MNASAERSVWASGRAYAMSLDEAARAALHERIRSHLPIVADGSIPIIARAWAIRGTR